MSRLITAMDVALRDRRGSVGAWIRWKGSVLIRNGQLHSLWDGVTVQGAPVEAFVNRSRWLATCPGCGNAEYVDPGTPIFFCLRCGNGGSTAARPVIFPAQLEEIEALLLNRPVLEGPGLNRIEILLHARAAFADLPRNWVPGVSTETLRTENEARGVNG